MDGKNGGGRGGGAPCWGQQEVSGFAPPIKHEIRIQGSGSGSWVVQLHACISHQCYNSFLLQLASFIYLFILHKLSTTDICVLNS